MRTVVYIDGFNLYFRLLKNRPDCRWLNLKKLAENVLSKSNSITGIKYYTARVSGRLDFDSPKRQQIYLTALKTISKLTIVEGMFLSKEKFSPLVCPPEFRPEIPAIQKPWPDVVKILKTEEKGSDVNLASHLLFDAFENKYDVAVVLSNDSDLVEPVRLVTKHMGKTVGLMSPVRSPNPELVKVASFVKRIRNSHLNASQFDNPLVLENNQQLFKPEKWI